MDRVNAATPQKEDDMILNTSNVNATNAGAYQGGDAVKIDIDGLDPAAVVRAIWDAAPVSRHGSGVEPSLADIREDFSFLAMITGASVYRGREVHFAIDRDERLLTAPPWALPAVEAMR